MHGGRRTLRSRLATACVRGRAACGIIAALLLCVGSSGETPAGEPAPAEPAVASTASPEAEEHFEKAVRPILAERCHGCHGAQKQWAGLRLDSRTAIIQGGESGPAVVPGKPRESELLRRVREKDDALRMPPAETGPPLTGAQIEALARWVEQGAAWPEALDAPAEPAVSAREHWAFQPIRKPEPPEVSDAAWVRTPIDRFVLHRLESEGLAPSPPAERRAFIRRAAYALTGLPPTPEEVDAFARDDSPDASARLIDRLLASPHYGEQWGRHWLDVARYSDTKGYVYAREERAFVHAWLYRDWVVRAFNDDLPYDRFLVLQLAADQAAPADAGAAAAMGFLSLGRRFLGVTPDIIDDRIDVVTRGTMGLTVSCARCHDHKYDPVPTADYYSLYGVFQNCYETLVPVPRAPGAAPPSAEFQAELEARRRKLDEAAAAARTEAGERFRQRIVDYLLAQRELEKYPEQGFDQLLSKEDLIPAAVRRWQSYLANAARNRDPVFVPWLAYAELPDEAFADGAADLGDWDAFLDGRVNPRIARAFAEPPASFRQVAERYGAVFEDVEREWQAAREAAAREGAPPPEAFADPDDEALRQVLYGDGSPCVIPDEPIINTESLFDSATVTSLWGLQGEVDRWLLQSPESAPHAGILRDRQYLVTPRIFRRGNPAERGDEVPRQFLEVIAGPDRTPFQQGSGRWELAQAIVSPENPLTARVWVNRVWMHHFGTGLVATPSDFGLRAEPPSHPELLDWLAAEFIESGWSTKALHRQILLSAAYRQSSTAERLTEPAQPQFRKAQTADPGNKLLWRTSARRLSFEELRDTLLAVSGELDPAAGGKPAELFPAGEARFRRSIYGFIDRQFVPDELRVFDFANPDLHAPQRAETTVPQQALFALNHPFVAGRARALVARLDAADAKRDLPEDARAKVVRLYRTVLQREPTAAQLEAALAFLEAGASESAEDDLPPAARDWTYGYGELDEPSGRLKDFQPLPHFTGSAWQGGPQWPDAELGWVQLTAQGGHAGNDLQHAAVRRWTAPAGGTVAVESTAAHDTAAGDGVRCWIVSSRWGVLESAPVHNGRRTLNVPAIDVEAGDTLDFVVDYHANLNNDQFLWAPEIRRIGAPSDTAADVTFWSAERHFAGPPSALLDPWEQLAQVLLVSNELMFVD